MRIPRLTILPLLAIAVLFITSAPAMAGTFLTEICLSLNSPMALQTLNSRLGVTSMGNNHFQLNGVIQDTSPGGTSPDIAVSGDAEIRANGDIIISANFQGPVDAFVVGGGETDALSIFLPVGAAGKWSDIISGSDPADPTLQPPLFVFHDEIHGPAAIVSCTGFPI